LTVKSSLKVARSETSKLRLSEHFYGLLPGTVRVRLNWLKIVILTLPTYSLSGLNFGLGLKNAALEPIPGLKGDRCLYYEEISTGGGFVVQQISIFSEGTGVLSAGFERPTGQLTY